MSGIIDKIKNFFVKSGEMEMKDILGGRSFGQTQSVGYLRMTPILQSASQIDDARFSTPKEIAIDTEGGYGVLNFKNPTDKLFIVPCHAAFMVKYAAQDHAMAHAGLVSAGKAKQYKTAMCIQSTQPGAITEANYEVEILPYPLRESAINVRETEGYSKLWTFIGNMNTKAGQLDEGSLSIFVKKFKQELDLFIAEFEPLTQQIGAVMWLDDKIVGIEVTPSVAYWRAVWKGIIRLCYGSAAILYAKTHGTDVLPRYRDVLNPADIHSLDELEQALLRSIETEENTAQEGIKALFGEKFVYKTEETEDVYKINTLLENSDYTGQTVTNENEIVYASVFAKNHESIIYST